MFIKSYFCKETNSFDKKMIKINRIRTTSYDVIAFYFYNSIGGNYDDTFGNTVTLESGIDGGIGAGSQGRGWLGLEIFPEINSGGDVGWGISGGEGV